MGEDLFFELPGSSIRGIPLLLPSGKHLDFGLVEIGCRPYCKRGQLTNKRNLFRDYLDAAYPVFNSEQRPEIYRTLAHYDPSKKIKLKSKFYGPEVIIVYSYITQAMLADISEEDRKRIFGTAGRSRWRKELLEDIIGTQDAERLHKMIVERKSTTGRKMSALRGTMAEILVQKDLEKTLPHGMSLFRNEDITYFTRRYPYGTEIDGLLLFYGEDRYIELIENLRKLDHLIVKDKWHG